MKEAHKRNRNPKYKQRYRVTNWPEYDRSLRNRGDITLWFSEDAIQAWAPMHNGKQGRPQKFSDLAIETVLTLRLVFHLPLRQAEGFVHSLLSMMGLQLPTPDHTTLSRRSSSLKPILFHRACSAQPLHLIVDSTGLSIHGEGPWSSGKKRRRGWRKLHIMVDEDGSIRSSCVSKWHTRDGSRVPHLLDGFDGDIASLTGDRGYDQRSVYRSVAKKNRGAATVIHPRSNAIVSRTDEWRQRDRHVHKIRREGVETWRRESGYYRQSTVENTFYRYKTLIGSRLRARGEAARQVEAAMACKSLNELLGQGRAESELIV